MNVYVFTVDDGTDHFPYLVVGAETKEQATDIAVHLASNHKATDGTVSDYPVRLYGSLESPGVIVTKGGAFVSEIYVDG